LANTIAISAGKPLWEATGSVASNALAISRWTGTTGHYYALTGGHSPPGRKGTVMIKTLIAPGAMVLVLGLAACTNPYDPGQRAVGGALIGAGAGAAIGAAAGGGTGAAIGAASGGALGAITGAATTPPPPPPPPPPGYYR
jgi:hypothetical protein